jgi:5-methylcytosine-specific restriction endonuclease McrA
MAERQRRVRWTGSIFCRKDGRWCAELTYPTMRGEKRKRRTLYARTREDAERKLNEFLEAEGADFERSREEMVFEARQLARHAPADWVALLESSRGVCFYCRAHVGIDALEQDHMVPVSRGGSDSIENLAPACPACNMSKHDMTAVEYIAFAALVASNAG